MAYVKLMLVYTHIYVYIYVYPVDGKPSCHSVVCAVELASTSIGRILCERRVGSWDEVCTPAVQE